MALYHTAIFVVVIMVFCNIILYPSLFTTLFRQYFGSGSKPDKQKGTNVEDSAHYPPHMRHGSPRSSPPHMEAQRDPRPGPFPAERAAAAMAAQGQDGSKSSSRGMMGSILPIYAFGIVLYFAYIMYRIFFKDTGQRDPVSGRPIRGCWSQNPGVQTTADQLRQRLGDQELHKRLREELLTEKLKSTPGPEQEQQQQATATATTSTATTSSASVRKKTQDTESPDMDIGSLQARLEDTERTMHKMMEYMSKMGIAMDQVTEQMAKGSAEDNWDCNAGDFIEGQDTEDANLTNSDESGTESEQENASNNSDSDGDSKDNLSEDDCKGNSGGLTTEEGNEKAEEDYGEMTQSSLDAAKDSTDFNFESGEGDCTDTIILEDEVKKGPMPDSQYLSAENFRRRNVIKDESEC